MNKNVWRLLLSGSCAVFVSILGVEAVLVIFGFRSGIDQQTKEATPIFFMVLVVALLMCILEKLSTPANKSEP